ncbi:MAG: hypothetical protein JXR77_01985 [Lentisphaeria bacterium]|nr:hypothetical protein [Lentisphaeria bacterium]
MKTRRIGFGLALGILGAGVLLAQQPPAGPPPREGGPPGMMPGERRPEAARAWRREGGPEQVPGRPPGPAGGGLAGNFLDRLKQSNPEEFERLSTLYRTDRQQFMQEIRRIMQERGLQMDPEQGPQPRRAFPAMGMMGEPRARPEEEKCQELARLYAETADGQEKTAIRQELQAAVQEAFEARLGNSRERIAHLEEQLTKFRQHLQNLEENRDAICRARVEELTRPPELKWEGNW